MRRATTTTRRLRTAPNRASCFVGPWLRPLPHGAREFREVILRSVVSVGGALGVACWLLACGLANRAHAQGAGRFPFQTRVPAPTLSGAGEWLNTSGPLDPSELRGKFVLLDFWTYCCINCMHILPELKKLEHAYPNNLVVVGIHSGKFENEKDAENIRAAILRYEIEHPVLNDPDYVLWNRYNVDTWPSLRLIDPEGNLVAASKGELDFETLDRTIKGALNYYRRRGVLDERPLTFDALRSQATETPLRFPGKVLADEAGDRLFIADSNHNRLVVTRLDGSLLDVIGSGAVGRADGGYEAASFHHPQGMALHAESLYVADTENHLLRKVDLAGRRVSTIAGTGEQRRESTPRAQRNLGPPLKVMLASPWALWIHDAALYVAMAGPHQIWRMPLDESQIGVYAGNGREDIVDGPLLPRGRSASSFAQPSGLASDGQWLYVADSEGSSIRAVPFDRTKPLRTVIGTADFAADRLFTFGDVDGVQPRARLQHPLDLVWGDGLLYVADSYNHKIKVVDPAANSVKTLAGSGRPGEQTDPPEFHEPGGLAFARGVLYVADTNNHRVCVLDPASGEMRALSIEGLASPRAAGDQRPPGVAGARQITLKPQQVHAVDGKLRLEVSLELPSQHKMNPDAPQRVKAESLDGEGLIPDAALSKPILLKVESTRFAVEYPLAAEEGSETLRVSLTYYYCEREAAGLCKVGGAVWTIPLKLSPDAPADHVPLGLSVD